MPTLSRISLLALVTLAALAAASPFVQPDTTLPFGSQVATVSWLESPSPNPNFVSQWNPIGTCGQTTTSGTPTELYADDPEKWDYVLGDKSWNYQNINGQQVSVNNLLLEKGQLTASTPGLIFFYFWNKLGVSARLYIGGLSNGTSSVSVDYIVSEITGPSDPTSAVRDGSMETGSFLSAWVPGTGFTQKTLGLPNGTGLPTKIISYQVNNDNIIQGEMSVFNLSGNATFYVYADDCTASPCPSLANVNPNGDGNHRRGNFGDAALSIQHDYTSNIESGGFAWYDLVGPNSCISTITGVDPFGFYSPRNSGDYGMPISIYGTAARAQFWYVMGSPSGEAPGTPAAFPLYVQGMTDPSTGVDVTGGWSFPFPASNPPTPSHQPTTTPLICCAQSALLGKDPDNTLRTLTWIPSGGVGLPARFWYNVSTGRQRGRN